jgi:hypothetical protein
MKTRIGLVLCLSVLPRIAAAEDPVSLAVLDPGGNPIVAVSVTENPDPKGVRYDVDTTFGANAEARALHLTLVRRGTEWSIEFPGGFKGGPFKKLVGVVKKSGSKITKRFKGLARLATDPAEAAALIAQGKAVKESMSADATTVVAAVNATPTFVLKDLAVAQLALSLRYYEWFYAHADGLSLYDPRDKKAIAAHVASTLLEIYPAANAGTCQAATQAPSYSMSSTDCPPDDFVPLSSVPLSQECYGRKGLYQNQDFICSSVAPQGVQLDTGNGIVPVSFRECCLEHDRAFFCGGVSATGVPTGAGPGTYTAWQTANAALVNCVSQALLEGYASTDSVPDSFILGSWESFFSNTGFPLIWFDSTLVGDAWQNGWNPPSILAGRLETCLCGGDKPVPLCENRCFVNDCSLPLAERIDKPAFENYCAGTCIWTCVEEWEDGNLLKRYKRKRVFDASGNVVDTGEDFDFSSCTPDYEMQCDCVPYERPSPPPGQCQIPEGFFNSLVLPTAQIVGNVNP